MMTQEKIKDILSYDKNSGIFVWIKPNSNREQKKVL